MTAYLLDTNHLSPLVTLGHSLRNKILAQVQAGDSFAIAAPALNEFLFGIATVPRAKTNLLEWESLRRSFIFYAIDEIDAQRAFELRINLRQRGRQLEVVDSFIAAIALRYDLHLLTTDQDFVTIPDLKLDNWW